MTGLSVPRRHLILWLAAAAIALGLVLLWASVAVADPQSAHESFTEVAQQLIHGRMDRLQRIFLVLGAMGLVSGLTVAFGYTAFAALDHRKD